MVSIMLALVFVSIYAEQPSIPTASAEAAVPDRRTVDELLYAPGSNPLLVALRRTFLPSRSVRATVLGIDLDAEELDIKRVPFGGISAGEPHRGRLYGGIPLPENPELYVVRRPDYAYGSTHAVKHLQIALAKFRAKAHYQGPLIVSDLSKPRGGRNRPHISHQSGRDVDIWLPLRCNRRGVTIRGGDLSASNRIAFKEFSASNARQIDWSASWELVKALIRTGQVEGIFLARSRQRFLRRAAIRDGVRGKALSELIQFPEKSLEPIVRHVRGHEKHIHVRFRCADYEAHCR